METQELDRRKTLHLAVLRVLDPPLLPFTGWMLVLLPYTASTCNMKS